MRCEATPVTWKRAKIEDKDSLIQNSHKSPSDAQKLGDAILAFCNDHAIASMNKYHLTHIGYARLILHTDNSISYFEKELCSKESPLLFNPSDFSWRWSQQKKTKGKEQLPAFHGTHIPSGAKWWAWHGLGENQLHFSGERAWWPKGPNAESMTIRFPDERQRYTFDDFVAVLAQLDIAALR